MLLVLANSLGLADAASLSFDAASLSFDADATFDATFDAWAAHVRRRPRAPQSPDCYSYSYSAQIDYEQILTPRSAIPLGYCSA